MRRFLQRLHGFRPHRREWWWGVNERLSAKTFSRKTVIAIVVGALVAHTVVMIANTPDDSRLLTGRQMTTSFKPETPEEKALLQDLRLATVDEQAIVVNQRRRPGGMVVWPAMYVALRDITLPPKPMGLAVVIALPKGTRWAAGPLTNQTLLFADWAFESPALQGALGREVSNQVCEPDGLYMVDIDAAKVCDEKFRASTSPEQMYANLRKLEPSEHVRHPALLHVWHYAPARDVYITTGDIRLAPHTDRKKRAPIILLARGHKVLGGQPGAAIVVADFDQGGQRLPLYNIIADPVYELGWWRGYPDFVCPSMSVAVQQQYYPGIC